MKNIGWIVTHLPAAYAPRDINWLLVFEGIYMKLTTKKKFLFAMLAHCLSFVMQTSKSIYPSANQYYETKFKLIPIEP